jgi:oxepin-CoA hydrolase/3-oxo-5,6-dehydrosuberyl-CoA semialdehyde dehydrogenase
VSAGGGRPGLGRKGLSAGRIIVRGSAEHLAREGTFMGEHILTTPRGLALQINAFDFPVWSMLEKPARTAVAQLYNTQPPLLATELQDRLITEAGRARIAGASA